MNELATRNNQIAQNDEQLRFSQEQIELIKKMYASGLNDVEWEHFLYVAQARQLNPLLGQIYAIKYKGKMTLQTGIGGFRLIADRSGKYAGNDPPKFKERDGRPIACQFTVYKFVNGQKCSFSGIAYYEEYKQVRSDGQINNMWLTKPFVMLAKCAEALALRMAFPELSGLYTHDEMAQAQNDIDIHPVVEKRESEEPLTVKKQTPNQDEIKKQCYNDAMDDDFLEQASDSELKILSKKLAVFEKKIQMSDKTQSKVDWKALTNHFNGTAPFEQWDRDTLVRFIKMLVKPKEPVDPVDEE